jgi:hypothetical protein
MTIEELVKGSLVEPGIGGVDGNLIYPTRLRTTASKNLIMTTRAHDFPTEKPEIIPASGHPPAAINPIASFSSIVRGRLFPCAQPSIWASVKCTLGNG